MSELFWELKGWELEDPHLKRRNALPFQRTIPFIPVENGLYIIRGPRQIGKTTWLKEVLSQKVKAKEKCFYLSCEKVQNSGELSEILKATRDYGTILLDEINYVEGWDKVVKSEIDSGKSKILMITGSHSVDLRRGADRMPGRFGAGQEFYLLPMSFSEFLEVRNQAGWNKKTHIENINDYFKIGGFPAALAEAGPKVQFPTKTLDTIRRWVVGDFVRLGKQENFVTELMIQLLKTMSSPVSLQTIAKKTSMGSHNTAQDYISVLEDCFALRTLYLVDQNSGSYRFRSNKKFYFRDPILFWLALKLDGKSYDEKHFEKLAEMVAAEHLCSRYDRVGYFSSPSSGEIDFFRHDAWALELKWSEIPTNLSKAYLKIALLNKKVWTKKNYLLEWPEM